MIAELLAILLTWFFGIGACSYLARTLNYPNPQPPVGIIDAVGDTILLPAFNAIVVHLGLLRYPLQGWQALAALAGAVAITFSFIAIRKDVALHDDWSRPRRGRFNAGGWYHAGFMLVQAYVVVLGLIAYYDELVAWLPALGFLALVLARLVQLANTYKRARKKDA